MLTHEPARCCTAYRNANGEQRFLINLERHSFILYKTALLARLQKCSRSQRSVTGSGE
jgi:hypothetical protein